MSPIDVRFTPSVPRNIPETGLDPQVLQELLLKNLYRRVTAVNVDLAEEIGLPLANVVDQALESLRRERLIDARGHAGFFVITDEGRRNAREALERCRYSGLAPVPLSQYIPSVMAQSLAESVISAEALQPIERSLVLNARLWSQLGPALNSGSTVLFHGAPGNGKTALANAIGDILPGHIYIPYALYVQGQIIALYDPTYHHAISEPIINGSQPIAQNPKRHHDLRWAYIKRPIVLGGSELQLSNFELGYDSVTKFHHAPLQLKANSGLLIIDDLGRQQVRAHELLNRWLSVLEKRRDSLTFNNGQKVEMPFDALVVFTTNLTPTEVGDEASLRRIRHKINVPDPTLNEYREIFNRVCREYVIAPNDALLAYLLREYYLKPGRPLRAAHPRALIQQIGDIAHFHRVQPELKKEWIDEACRNFFVT